MLPFKGYLYAGVTLCVVSIFSYSLYSWHYSVIDSLEKQLRTAQIDNKAKEITINNLGVQIVQLMENNKITGFESYFKGIADANNTTVSDKLIF